MKSTADKFSIAIRGAPLVQGVAYGLALLTLLLAISTSQAANYEAYRLGPGDRVRLTIFGHENLSGEFEVDSAGRLALPLISFVAAAELTVPELEQAVIDKLKPGYLKNPRVSAEVLNYRPFYILGEVARPGSYEFEAGTTLIKAVAMAGGFTYRAKKAAVVISRRAKGEQREIRATAGTVILPGDVIEVPERYW